MKSAAETYAALVVWSRKTTDLNSTLALLHWDLSTKTPAAGADYRSQVITTLVGIRHAHFTDPAIGEQLARVKSADFTADLHSSEAVNVREWIRSYEKAVKIPLELAKRSALITSQSRMVWERYRPENDWARFRPWLEQVVEIKREEADALGYSTEAYDALLDWYEPDATAASIEPKFQRLIPALVKILEAIQASGPPPGMSNTPYFPVEDQRAFATLAAEKVGYDFSAGRLDVSAHPFTTGIGPKDVRITTRYAEHDFNDAFFSVLHEVGHALYHQGLPLEHWGTPVCSPASLGLNESQSRMWENFVGRSRPFWRYFYPKARERFHTLSHVAFDDFYREVNRVTPSLIRTEADEVTYNIHVLLRFELELDLMRRKLEPRDLPEAWNAAMGRYLGVTPPDHKDGAMQDVHWSLGAIGYFPTYTLGNMYAAQLFAAAQRDIPNLNGDMERGDFGALLSWLRRHIHQEGRTFSAAELVLRVTGDEPSPHYLIDYLAEKYGELYGFDPREVKTGV